MVVVLTRPVAVPPGLQVPIRPRLDYSNVSCLHYAKHSRSEAMRWALALSTIPHPTESPDAEWITGQLGRVIGEDRCLASFDMDEGRHARVIEAMHTNDFVYISGPSQCGKTTLLPLFATMSAEQYINVQGQPGVKENHAKSSPKLIIVERVAAAAVSMRKHLKKVLPMYQAQVYNDPASGTFGQIIGEDREKALGAYNKPLTSMENVNACIVDALTAIEMLNAGFVGTVAIENISTSHYWAELPLLLSTCAKRLDSHDLGTVLFVNNTDLPDNGKVCREYTDKLMTNEGFFIGECALVYNDASGQTPLKPFLTAVNVTSDFLTEKGFEPAPQHMAGAITAIENALHDAKINYTVNNYHAWERHTLKGTPIEEVVNCKIPRHQFHKQILSGALHSIVSSLVLKWIAESGPNDNMVRMKNIVIVVAHPEQISDVGTMFRNMKWKKIPINGENTGRVPVDRRDRSQIDINDDTAEGGRNSNKMDAFKSCRISFSDKASASYYHQTNVDMHIEAVPGVAPNGFFRGLLTITTEDIAVSLEDPNLGATIVTVAKQRPGVYNRAGLEVPVREFRDGSTIQRLWGRHARGSDYRGYFYVIGHEKTIEEYWEHCYAESTQHNSLTMPLLLREHCAIETRRLKWNRREMSWLPVLSNPPHTDHVINDALRMGLIDLDEETGRYYFKEPVRALLRTFPQMQVDTAIMVALGVKMGVAAHVIALAAERTSRGRLLQANIGFRNDTNNDTDNVHGGTSHLFEFFEDMVVNGMRHSPGRGLQQQVVDTYESESVCAADLLVSYILAYRVTEEVPERPCKDAWTMPPVNANNFFGGRFDITSVSSTTLNAMGSKMKKLLQDRRNIPSASLVSAIFKDEGREKWEYDMKQIVRIMKMTGFIPMDAQPLKSDAWNCFSVTKTSPLLSKKGRSVLSAIITMSSCLVGEYTGQVVTSMRTSQQLPPRYDVCMDFSTAGVPIQRLVHGYKLTQVDTKEEGERKYAVYTRSDAVVHNDREVDRWHARIHPVSMGQLALLVNSIGGYRMEEALDGGHHELTVLLPSPPSGIKFQVEIHNRVVAEFVEKARARLSYCLYDVMGWRSPLQPEAIELVQFIADCWDAFA